MNRLLIEIGCEEIPSGYIIPALNAFKKQILLALSQNRIDHGEAQILGTPRRLVLIVDEVADMQKALTSQVKGPPEKVGFDENGNPTIAAEKFAAKAGVAVDRITVEDTSRGRYLTAVVEEKCESSLLILERMLEKQILLIPFPKRMRWGDLSISFARPIISLVGLLGDKVLDFSVGNIKSSSRIFGHQFMHPGKFKVASADLYLGVVESIGVIPDISKRRAVLVKAIEAEAKAYDARVLEDEELVDIVTNLVENPFPVVGSFDEEFLEVPDEVLITAMREHQKYFALVDESGGLKPKFIAVNNTRAKDMQLVARGHEKVLRARLSDAKFFYEVDCRSSLDEFAEKLKAVTFQEKLGTVHDKTLRIKSLAKYLAAESAYENKAELVTNVIRASKICKADLVSQVVIEFTKLQGVIGRAYALRSGENPEVAAAIEQHYRPVRSGGRLPRNPTACLLSIADKLDTIAGCFSVDLIPSGGADPYALRRQGIGIIQILMEEKLGFGLGAVIDKALDAFMEDPDKKREKGLKIKGFLQNRMVNILTDMGFSKGAVNSALFASFSSVPDVVLRVKALDTLRREPDFEPLAVTFKRVENILKKAGNSGVASVDETLFEDPSETELYGAAKVVKEGVKGFIDEGAYDKALSLIATLRETVDAFFDGVMVMAEDEMIRQNRIAVLSSVSDLFKDIADFSKI